MTAAIGIVGLGLVGRALAARLQGQGWRPFGFDRSPEAMAGFAAAGAQPVASLPELGQQVSCVILAVFDTHGVLDVLEGPQGLLSPGSQVRTVIDCSTGSPELLEPLAARLRARGIEFIEAPLSGSSQQIQAGEAAALVGGSDDGVRAARPVLEALSTRVIHVGPAGSGAKAKLATNLVLGLNRAALAEGFAFAEALGIAPERFLELVLATPARSDAALVKGPLMVSEDFTPRSRIRQHLKDVRLMLSAGEQAQLALPFSALHARLMQEAVDAGEGDLDNAAIVRRLRRRRPD